MLDAECKLSSICPYCSLWGAFFCAQCYAPNSASVFDPLSSLLTYVLSYSCWHQAYKENHTDWEGSLASRRFKLPSICAWDRTFRDFTVFWNYLEDPCNVMVSMTGVLLCYWWPWLLKERLKVSASSCGPRFFLSVLLNLKWCSTHPSLLPSILQHTGQRQVL